MRSEYKQSLFRLKLITFFALSFELETDLETHNGLEIVVYSRISSSNIFKKKNKTIIGLTSIPLNVMKESQQITEEWFELEQTTD